MTEQLQLFDELEQVNCSKCKKEEAEPDHTCPYQSDINGDYESLCNCCRYCTQICADEI